MAAGFWGGINLRHFIDYLAGWSIRGWGEWPERRILCKTYLFMKRYTFSLLAAFALLAALSFAHPTAFHSYVSFKGTKQGQLKGSAPGKGGREKDGWFALNSFELGTEVPVDSKSSGKPAAARQHNPIHITKEVDAASPLLLNAHYSNEVFESVIIQTQDDQNKTTRRITLTNATIADIKKNGNLEDISFTFEKIESQQ
jgi:type VI secretion system Hcp family effector